MDLKAKIVKWTRLTSLYLFWPAVLLIAWGELTPSPPHWTADLWDKSLHFTAYFGLASMATVVLGRRRRTLFALLALVALGGLLEILQGYTGRDPDILDELANALGVVSGGGIGVLFLRLFRQRRLVPEAGEKDL